MQNNTLPKKKKIKKQNELNLKKIEHVTKLKSEIKERQKAKKKSKSLKK